MKKHEFIAVPRPTKGFYQHAITNQFDLDKTVKAMHQERIKVLQKEMVEVSFLNNQQSKIGPILKEIKQVRSLINSGRQKLHAY